MKKIIILLGLLSNWWSLQAQQRDSSFSFSAEEKKEIQALYSYYTQNGNHSAVTGGEGTENLQVQAISFKGTHTVKKNRFISWNAGIDFITSASTDRIDSVLSSASLVDRRGYASLNAGFQDKKNREWQIGSGFSIESDYLSIPIRTRLRLPYKKNKQLQLGVELAFDDLRWGRLNPDYYAPVTLIYPKELRGYIHLDKYRRISGTVMSQVLIDLNARTNLSLQSSISRQEGLLSTPFHRVYFSNSSMSIEKLPSTRNKISFAATLRYFSGKKHIFRTTGGLYQDDWGISGITLEEDYQLKIKPGLYLGSFLRGYYQSGTRYFAPKNEHEIGESNYTSDFDLSLFTSFHAGFSLHFDPVTKILQKFPMKNISLRTGYYQRSDGLKSVSISLLLHLK